jgi:homopolymeric O-antigen transport system ATP-binding protein
MSAIIEARDLSKRYRLGVLGLEGETFREFLIRLGRGPLRGVRPDPDHGAGPEYLWALKDVSFDIGEGEVVGVIGANGAGKSTLLKILSRITEPTEGVVTLRGRLASLLEVGTGFHPELTGRENVYLNGAILGMRRAEINARFDEIVAFSEVEKFIDTPVKRYSSGMYVRLAFSVAAHLDPEILVVDEVLSVGDFAFQKKCIGKMTQVSQGGRTVLFVSHNMAATEKLCGEAIVLQQGRLSFKGAVKEALQFYLASVTPRPQGSEGHVADLSGSPRSLLDGPRRLKRLELYTTDGRPLSGGLMVGAPIAVRIGFELEVLVPRFEVWVQFETLFGQVVFVASTRFTMEELANERVGEQSISLQIPSLTLVPGQYQLRVALGIGNSVVDMVDAAAQLSVVPSDYYGLGRLPSTGAVVLEHHWRFG